MGGGPSVRLGWSLRSESAVEQGSHHERSTKELGQVIRIDDERVQDYFERVQDYLRRAVRGSVEETLNAMLDAEAERLCNAGRYERTEARRDTRAGSYSRKLQTQATVIKNRGQKVTELALVPQAPI